MSMFDLHERFAYELCKMCVEPDNADILDDELYILYADIYDQCVAVSKLLSYGANVQQKELEQTSNHLFNLLESLPYYSNVMDYALSLYTLLSAGYSYDNVRDSYRTLLYIIVSSYNIIRKIDND